MTDRPRRAVVLGLFAGACVIRAFAYAGLTLGDDTIYLDAILRAAHGEWPPLPTHWDTRLVMTLPPAALLHLFGFTPALLVVVQVVASLAKVAAVYLFAARYFDARTATGACAIAAVFPGDVIFATHLFPDGVVGACSAIAILAFLAALLDDAPRLALCAGGWLAVGYLARETVVLDAPVLLVLAVLSSARRRWALAAWTLLLPAITVALEAGLYAWTTGDPLYRLHAVLRQQADPENLRMIATSTAGGSFWTDPLLMLVTSHEFGLVLVAGLVAAAVGLRSTDRIPRLLAAWMVAGWAWTSFGTTSPAAWVVLQRDGRYLLELGAPAALLIAWGVRTWQPAWRAIVAALLIVSSLAAVSMEKGGTVTTAHRAVLARPLPGDVAFDPVEYAAARWVSGLLTPVLFAQLAEAPGRRWESLPGHRLVSLRDPGLHTIVLGPLARDAVAEEVRAAGFVLTDTVAAEVPRARQIVGRVLASLPSQEARAARATAGRPLRIFQRP